MHTVKKSPRQQTMRRTAKLIRQVLAGLRMRLDDELRAKNVTAAQVRFLYELSQRAGSTGAQLARACYVTPQSAQAMMARAVHRGWVTRGKDDDNHRLVIATLTPAGRRLLDEADAIFARLESEVWAGVTLAELHAMNDVLARGLARLEEH